jgi:hypothetical protein
MSSIAPASGKQEWVAARFKPMMNDIYNRKANVERRRPMSDDFYQRQLRDQQWRQQQDMQRQMQEQARQQQEQRQWSDQLWRRDQDALRQVRQQQTVARQQLLQQQDEEMQAQLRAAAEEAERTRATSSAGRPTQPLAPTITTPNLLDRGPNPHDEAGSVIGLGLELLKRPGIGAALPLIAVGVSMGAKWLAARRLAQLEADAACRQCGGTNEPGYNFCIHCGIQLG